VIYCNLFLIINQLFFNILYMMNCKIKDQLKSSLFLSISLQMWLIKAFDGAHDQGTRLRSCAPSRSDLRRFRSRLRHSIIIPLWLSSNIRFAWVCQSQWLGLRRLHFPITEQPGAQGLILT